MIQHDSGKMGTCLPGLPPNRIAPDDGGGGGPRRVSGSAARFIPANGAVPVATEGVALIASAVSRPHFSFLCSGVRCRILRLPGLGSGTARGV